MAETPDRASAKDAGSGIITSDEFALTTKVISSGQPVPDKARISPVGIPVPSENISTDGEFSVPCCASQRSYAKSNMQPTGSTPGVIRICRVVQSSSLWFRK